MALMEASLSFNNVTTVNKDPSSTWVCNNLLSEDGRHACRARWMKRGGMRRRQRLRCEASSMGGFTTGPASQYAKEMERLAAKEALLFAIKDAGGLQASMSGSTNSAWCIDINERIINVERLNPTPRPTTSPLLEGIWHFKWVGAGNPGLFAANALLRTILASLEEVSLLILDGSAKVTADLRILNAIESKFLVTSRLTVEGPSRMKEEYIDGLLATPRIYTGAIPSQLKGVHEQLGDALQRLPNQVKDMMNTGLKIPIAGTLERQLLISYLDEQLLISRNASGIPDVLERIDGTTVVPDPVPEYVS